MRGEINARLRGEQRSEREREENNTKKIFLCVSFFERKKQENLNYESHLGMEFMRKILY